MLRRGWRHAEWRKSDTRGLALCDSVGRQCPERQRVRQWSPGSGQGGEEWEVSVLRDVYGVSFWGDEMFWNLTVVMVAHLVTVQNPPKFYTLKW